MNNPHLIRITKISDCLEALQEFSNCLKSLQQCTSSEKQSFATKFIKKGNFIIAKDDLDETTGFIAYYANDAIHKCSYISMIAVQPQFRGKHIGSTLMDYCISDCITKGMCYLKLEVSKDNLAAKDFYLKKGFIKSKEEATATKYFFEKFLHSV